MVKSKEIISDAQLLSELKEFLSYNPKTGQFAWIKEKKKGMGYFVNNSGRPFFKYKKQKIYLGWLAWLFTYGVFPNGKLTYIDENCCNAKINNLQQQGDKEVFHNDTELLVALKKYISYSPKTGEFIWIRKINHYSRIKIGEIAKSLNPNGYIGIELLGKTYLAHRLAWLYVHGEMPKDFIDHKNGKRDDNRIDNLRECSHAENMQNVRSAFKGNNLGILGVAIRGNKYCSRITVLGKNIWLGYYNTAEEAHEAYLKAKRKYHEFCTI